MNQEFDTDHFGHNIEIPWDDLNKHIKKLEKFNCNVSISNEYTLKIQLPISPLVVTNIDRENSFLYIMTKMPPANSYNFDNDKDQLIIKWYF